MQQAAGKILRFGAYGRYANLERNDEVLLRELDDLHVAIKHARHAIKWYGNVPTSQTVGDTSSERLTETASAPPGATAVDHVGVLIRAYRDHPHVHEVAVAQVVSNLEKLQAAIEGKGRVVSDE